MEYCCPDDEGFEVPLIWGMKIRESPIAYSVLRTLTEERKPDIGRFG